MANTNKKTEVTRQDSIKIETKDGKTVCTIECLDKDLASILKTLYEDRTKLKLYPYGYPYPYTFWYNIPNKELPVWTSVTHTENTFNTPETFEIKQAIDVNSTTTTN